MDEDLAFIEAYERGDRDALESLVRKYRQEIYYLCLRMVRQEEDAEEMAQQTFFNAFRGIDKFRRKSKFRTWLYQIAINLCRTHAGSRKTTEELPDDFGTREMEAASPEADIMRMESVSEVQEELRKLSSKQREAVILRVYHEVDYNEIGRIIGCSARTAKVHFHYGIENLRKRLRKRQ
ncbi:MAG: sigma-70 family RNA polymerase sigma factor [Spirochaetota bacterium]